MRQVRTHAYAVPSAGAWLHPHELAALIGLPAWMLGLFVHLVLRSDFKSGAGRTGYGELINACTPDQPARGPRLWAPSRDEVKDGLRRFEALRIFGLDRLRSEQLQSINFLLAPRTGRGVPSGKLPRELSPGPHEGKKPKLTPGTRPGLSAANTSLPTLPAAEVVHSPPAAVKAKLEAVADRLRRGSSVRAPRS